MSAHRVAFVAFVALLAASIGACAPAEIPDVDGGSLCRVDDDCDDDVFCNGVELCAPDAGGADSRGCIGGASECVDGCDEARDRCGDACVDRDGDGAGDESCGGADCDDEDGNRFPGNPEVCDVLDHDEDCDPDTFGERDADEDGALDAACCNGSVCGDDCDDTRRFVNRENPELCDRIDNDCDGAIDEAIEPVLWYRDADADLAGDPGDAIEACRPQPGRVLDARDCDDDTAARNPRARETCNGIDDDCDSMIDEGLGPDIGVLCRVDGASGACAEGVTRCDGGGGIVCFQTHTATAETCDGVDEDCDGASDEAVGGGDTCTVPGGIGTCAAGTTRCGGAAGFVCEGRPPSAELCTPENENCDAAGGGYDGLECAPGATQACDICASPRITGTRTCRSICTYDLCRPPPVDVSWTPGSPTFTAYTPVRGHAEGGDWVMRFDEVRSDVFWRSEFDVVHGVRVALAPGRYRLILRWRWDGTEPPIQPNVGVRIVWDSALSDGSTIWAVFRRGAGGVELTAAETFTLDECMGGEIVFTQGIVLEPSVGTIRIREARLIRED